MDIEDQEENSINDSMEGEDQVEVLEEGENFEIKKGEWYKVKEKGERKKVETLHRVGKDQSWGGKMFMTYKI